VDAPAIWPAKGSSEGVMRVPERRASTIPALDGVRGLAILLVLWSHSGPRLAAYDIHLP
jgi:peptidoglycan/LPS O-acetylase OafA/YrhL